MTSPESTRRDFLQTSALAAAGAYVAPRDLLAPPLRPEAPQHLILVAFAGGVRKKEVLGHDQNAPNINRIARQGVAAPKVRCQNLGHYGAALSILTGHSEAMGIRENERGTNPTLFEMLRKDFGLEGGDVWLSTSNGAQGRLFAGSDHPDYGSSYAANVLDGDGLFNVEFKNVLNNYGRPQADSEHARELVNKFRGALDTSGLAGTDLPDAERIQQIEKFVLDELTGQTARITGPGAGDAKAIRVAGNILRVFRPRVLGITLQNHDIAHGSYNGYVEVIRRNDEEIGALWDAVQQDPELRDKTAIAILPEFGRDKDLNERNGLDHGDRSDELHEVFFVGAGPGFRKGRVFDRELRTVDICPTLLSLYSGGRSLPRRFEGKVVKGLIG